MNRGMPGLPVHHRLTECIQTHVHQVSDAIQPSHPLHPLLFLFPIPPRIRVFSNESTFRMRWPSVRVSASASLLSMIAFRIDFIFLMSKGHSNVFSSTTIWQHQFFGSPPSLWSNCHIHTWLLEKNITLTLRTFVQNVKSLLFNTVPGFVIAFLPRSKCLLISYLQSLSTMILSSQT